MKIRAIEAGAFVPNRLTGSGICGRTSEPSAVVGSRAFPLLCRQQRIGPYFADFCCGAQHLIIELDGSQHAEPEEERKDGLRTAYLNHQGYRVLRFWNEQVNSDLEGALAKSFMQP